MNAVDLKATIYTLYEISQNRSPLSIWKEIVECINEDYPEKYRTVGLKKYRLLIASSAQYSPSKRYIRYRSINAHIRSKSGLPTLIDFSLGNFVFEVNKPDVPIPTADVYETVWVRAATRISIKEHLSAIKDFLLDMDESGWYLTDADQHKIQITRPIIETGSGLTSYDPANVSRIAGNPYWMPENLSVGIHYIDSGNSHGKLAERLQSSWQSLFRNRAISIIDDVISPLIGENVSSLIVLADNVDLNNTPILRDLFRKWESEKIRFKICKISTTYKQYPLKNICFDLAVLAGTIPWIPKVHVPTAVSFDAGHLVLNNQSRWACAKADNNLTITDIKFIDTILAEHIPASVISAFWPTDSTSIIFRDGRLANERGLFEKNAIAENKVIFEVKKNPTAILYRGHIDSPSAAHYSDSIVDAHGDVLLQTLTQPEGDCIFPLRISCNDISEDYVGFINSVLMHTATPSLSIFQQPRLPGVIYYADLASKLDRGGWTQIIGRGYSLQGIIPN